MNIGRMVGALAGSFGGAALGGALAGRTGRMVGSLVGSMMGSRGTSGAGGIGSALSGFKAKFDGGDEVAQFDLDDDTAVILVRAMCNAAKADGHVDETEINNIISRAGDLDEEAEALVRAELAAPLDLDGFVATVPRGMEAEVDTLAEANYLADLRSRLGLSDGQVNEIHQGLGIPLG